MAPRSVSLAGPDDTEALLAFAARHPLSWTDFESYARTRPPEPDCWLARAPGAPGSGDEVLAAAIDDGLTISVAGEASALDAIAQVTDLDTKLVISGRADDVRSFARHATLPRRARDEHFMAVTRATLLSVPQQAPLRVATEDDLPMLVRSRTAALEEEYRIPVPEGSPLYRDLADAVGRAVALRGVAIWVENGDCAFTAQLVTKTDNAAMFGDLYVAPALRGKGRATRALATFCDWLMTESEHVVLRVDVDNEPALRLYERVGFHVVDSFCSSLGASGTTPGAS